MHISSKLRSVVATLLLAAPIAACTDLSTREQATYSTPDTEQCTFTQGFWKNHPEAWPVNSLSLGGNVYTQAQLLLILNTPVRGNGLISLAHQLIAAKLNVAFGAPDDDIADEIAAADALIGALLVPPIGSGYLHPSVTSALNDELDDFNNSQLTGDECEPDEPKCGDHTVDPGEECDDGNTTNGDGCSATCETEKVPCCGDHVVDPGETCDDGN